MPEELDARRIGMRHLAQYAVLALKRLVESESAACFGKLSVEGWRPGAPEAGHQSVARKLNAADLKFGFEELPVAPSLIFGLSADRFVGRCSDEPGDVVVADYVCTFWSSPAW